MSTKVVTPEQIDEMRAALRRGRKTITLKLKGSKRTMTFLLESTGSRKHFRYRAVGKLGLPMGVATRKAEAPAETFKRLWPNG